MNTLDIYVAQSKIDKPTPYLGGKPVYYAWSCDGYLGNEQKFHKSKALKRGANDQPIGSNELLLQALTESINLSVKTIRTNVSKSILYTNNIQFRELVVALINPKDPRLAVRVVKFQKGFADPLLATRSQLALLDFLQQSELKIVEPGTDPLFMKCKGSAWLARNEISRGSH